MTYRAPTKIELRRLNELLDTGIRPRDIASAMGLHVNYIWEWRRNIGRSDRAPPLKNDPVRQRQLVDLIAQGLSLERIRKLLRCDKRAIRAERRRQGIGHTKKPGATPKLPDADLAGLLRQGLSRKKVIERSGVWVEWKRIKSIRDRYGIATPKGGRPRKQLSAATSFAPANE